ncbi:MAG: hypothetical protein FJZ57_07210, partial [Chlamydiae bacterium]|nr:hypothetical protein [Chlamydiota bacterium]
LDFGAKTSSEFPSQKKIKGTKIPTLEEVILEIKNSKHPRASNIRLNIELKRDMRSPHLSLSAQEIVVKVLDIIHKHNFTHRVQYSSFDPEILILLRNKEPDSILSCLFSQEILNFISTNLNKPGLDFIISFAKKNKINILSPDHTLIKDQTQISEIKKSGFKVVVWTVNDSDRCLELYKMGVDGIITDTPQKIVSLFNNSFPIKG